MFKGIFGGLLMATGALVLAAGVVGVLVVVERALANREKDRQPPATPETPAQPPVVAAAAPPPAPAKAERHFSIKRTKSEVGYVYWILEGHGKYKCFVLCDSWEEAMEQAKARLEGESAETDEFAFVRA